MFWINLGHWQHCMNEGSYLTIQIWRTTYQSRFFSRELRNWWQNYQKVRAHLYEHGGIYSFSFSTQFVRLSHQLGRSNSQVTGFFLLLFAEDCQLTIGIGKGAFFGRTLYKYLNRINLATFIAAAR